MYKRQIIYLLYIYLYYIICYKIYIETLLFADDQAILSDSENRLQMGIHLLNRICKDSGLQISTHKTNVMAFSGTDLVRAKIVIDSTVLEQVRNFKYLGYSVSYNAYNDVVNKLHKFNLMCGTIRRDLKAASKGTRLKFYKVIALLALLYLSLIHI